jgi:predicted MPP superfamily phosphohydrolase
MISRRRLLWTGAGAAGAAAAYPVLLEPRWLEFTRTRVPKVVRGAGGSLRVLHMSDFHFSWAVPLSTIERAIDTGLSARPDLICLTGDFITHRYDFDERAYVRSLRRLTATCATFAVLGNHDGGRWARERRGFADHGLVERMLAEAGVRLLHNRSEELEVRGSKLMLVGVGDLWAGELQAERAFQAVRAEMPVLLLSHNPDSKDELRAFRWDLMLCGHTHGGQVIIPFAGPRYAPVNDKRFVAGLHEWEGRRMYITRGVGNLGGVRFRCRPEVSFLELG